MKRIFLLIILVQCCCLADAFAQWPWWDNNNEDNIISLKGFRPIDLIDLPTANILTESTDKESATDKYFNLSLRVYKQGGMIGGISVGLTRHLMFGVTYGGQNLIGAGDVAWNPAPGIHVRYQLFTEAYPFPPAIALGFSSQGFGSYSTEFQRYEIKSPGIYIAVSKNYNVTALDMGIHGGVNFSQEQGRGDKDVNIFFGAHLIMEDELSLVWEYDLGINDNSEASFGAGRGYMNAGIRWLFVNRLIIEFSVKNLLKNQKDAAGNIIPYSNRELKIIYGQKL